MEPQKSAGVSSEKLERSLEKKPEMTPPTPTVEEDSDDDDELDGEILPISGYRDGSTYLIYLTV